MFYLLGAPDGLWRAHPLAYVTLAGSKSPGIATGSPGIVRMSAPIIRGGPTQRSPSHTQA